MSNSTVLLLILDGWGSSKKSNDNAISIAHTPQWDEWLKMPCVTELEASGAVVGLPEGQMGNSEVGHMHIGAGRIIKQNLSLISGDIDSGAFHQKKILLKLIKQTQESNNAIHLVGLVSTGGVHSHQNHLYALVDLLQEKKVTKAYIHAITDGRDTPPTDALTEIKSLKNTLDKTPYHLASLCGRFYAMDRDKRWDRTQKYYQLLTEEHTDIIKDPIDYINTSYENKVFDEFLPPTPLLGHTPINENDLVIFFNFRSDRARQLSNALSLKNFNGFIRKRSIDFTLLTMTDYEPNQSSPCIYPSEIPKNTLGECLEKANKTQLRMAETEKYAHVTFFLNGGKEAPFHLEERVLVDSPKVRTYDLKPEMSAVALTDKLIEAIHSQKYQLIICNYANADMLGHTGNLAATISSIETLDTCLVRINKIAKEKGIEILVTADHGNAEIMINPETGEPHTSHTTSPVPFIYIGPDNNKKITNTNGSLIDIAPTVLTLLSIPIPSEMKGTSLLQSLKV